MESGEVRLMGRLYEIYLLDHKTLFSLAAGSMKMAKVESKQNPRFLGLFPSLRRVNCPAGFTKP